jgi:beta-glucanase (GH16 family)
MQGEKNVEAARPLARTRRGGRRLVVTALLGAVILAAWVGVGAGPAAAAKKKSSWATVRTEEFTGSSLPTGCGDYSGKYAGGKSAWSSKDVTVSKGLLKLKIEKRKVSGEPYASGGVGCWGWAQKYGRYEIKAKVPAGKGIDSYFTLWPAKGNDTAWTGLELLAPGTTQTAYVTNGYGKAAETAQVNGTYADSFHDYVIEWAPNLVRITVDGKEIYYSTRSYAGSRWFGMVVSNGDTLTGVPDATTKLPASFAIDTVKVSSYTGVPPKDPHTATSSVDPSRVNGVPTPVPTTIPPTADAGKVPAGGSQARVSALEPVSENDDSPSLAGGIWPWLLGGSLIAGLAAVTLTHPRNRFGRHKPGDE